MWSVVIAFNLFVQTVGKVNYVVLIVYRNYQIMFRLVQRNKVKGMAFNLQNHFQSGQRMV